MIHEKETLEYIKNNKIRRNVWYLLKTGLFCQFWDKQENLGEAGIIHPGGYIRFDHYAADWNRLIFSLLNEHEDKMCHFPIEYLDTHLDVEKSHQDYIDAMRELSINDTYRFNKCVEAYEESNQIAFKWDLS